MKIALTLWASGKSLRDPPHGFQDYTLRTTELRYRSSVVAENEIIVTWKRSTYISILPKLPDVGSLYQSWHSFWLPRHLWSKMAPQYPLYNPASKEGRACPLPLSTCSRSCIYHFPHIPSAQPWTKSLLLSFTEDWEMSLISLAIYSITIDKGENRYGDKSQSLLHWPFSLGSVGHSPRKELRQARTYFTPAQKVKEAGPDNEQNSHSKISLPVHLSHKNKEVSKQLGLQIGSRSSHKQQQTGARDQSQWKLTS